MKRLISFSFCGDNPRHTVNAIVNAMLAPSIYPGWTCRFAVDDSVPAAVIAALQAFPSVEVVRMPRHTDGAAMVWRFLPAAEPDVDAVIVRDTDAWLSRREAVCVEDWLESGRDFHIVRDHCDHSLPMPAGLWGVRGGVLSDLPEWVAEHPGTSDQGFLAERVSPLALGNALVHRGDQSDAHGDGAVPMPEAIEPPTSAVGASFLEAHRLNAFRCTRCGRTHAAYVGARFDRIPLAALEAVRTALERKGIDWAAIPGLLEAIDAWGEPPSADTSPAPDDDLPPAAPDEAVIGTGPADDDGGQPSSEHVVELEETIRWLEAELEQEAADAARRADELRERHRRMRELEAQVAAYRSPFREYPGGCGVDLVVLPTHGSVPAVAAEYAERRHRAFVLERQGDAASAGAASREGACLYRVPLPDGDGLEHQLGALEDFCRRAAVGRAIMVVDDPSWTDLAIAASSRFAWPIAYRQTGAAGAGGARLAANSDLLLPSGSFDATSDRRQLEEAFRDLYPRVAIIVVSFDNGNYLDLCLESIFEHSLYPNLEVIVVDNGPSEATAAVVARHAEREPRLRVITSGANLGFAGACNLGIEHAAGADYVVLMNDDTIATRGWLGGLVRRLRDERIGEIGPVTNSAGNGARIDVPYRDPSEMHAFAATNAEAHAGELVDLPMLAMFCVAMRSAVLAKIGPLDERFSVGMYEDDDYAMRLRRAGYRIVCARDVFVHHWGGASFRKLDDAAHARIHETHSRTFADLWGRESAGVERPTSPLGARAGEVVERFAEHLTDRFGTGPVEVLRDGSIPDDHDWAPATVLTGPDEETLRSDVEAAGAAVAFSGCSSGEAVVVAVPEPFSFTPPAGFAVTVFVPVFNEADVLRACVAHHLANGLAVHLVDNWSTDGSFELARELARDARVTVERFPPDAPPHGYEWAALLGRIEALAATGNHDWAVLADADEARVPPWPGRTVREALWAVDRAGFTAVDHTVVVFPPTDDVFMPGTDPQEHFRYAEFWTGPGCAPQIKAWRRPPWPARLAPTGGHEAEFEGRRLFPFNFLDKHYPIRSQAHGERKVYGERIPRWMESERQRGWHAQYDDLVQGDGFIRSADGLELFEAERFLRDHLVECLTRIGIGEPGRLPSGSR